MHEDGQGGEQNVVQLGSYPPFITQGTQNKVGLTKHDSDNYQDTPAVVITTESSETGITNTTLLSDASSKTVPTTRITQSNHDRNKMNMTTAEEKLITDKDEEVSSNPIITFPNLNELTEEKLITDKDEEVSSNPIITFPNLNELTEEKLITDKDEEVSSNPIITFPNLNELRNSVYPTTANKELSQSVQDINYDAVEEEATILKHQEEEAFSNTVLGNRHHFRNHLVIAFMSMTLVICLLILLCCFFIDNPETQDKLFKRIAAMQQDMQRKGKESDSDIIKMKKISSLGNPSEGQSVENGSSAKLPRQARQTSLSRK
ncbi:uncharacterized protein LOC115474432 [Microcaecilia unicolor]|uniref:Uncharacterized protein LOC115474432 n=1 Tax=Microcaecilia unicolor TaxID=1415580 RepID=A0A6P7YLU4_9AMPH|nr:uncharacterized protein LOC115474432 [Microcaecilia unicolor]